MACETIRGWERTMHEGQVQLPDGRVLAYAEYGSPQGRPLLALHGTPGSRLTWSPVDDPATEAGIRVLAPDRPGYGRSSSAKHLTFRMFAADVVHLLDELSVQEVTVAGASGGGGFAAALAAAHPERVTRLVLACALLPGVPRSALQDQLWQGRVLRVLARVAPGVLGAILAKQTRQLSGLDLEQVQQALGTLPEPDKRVMRAPAGMSVVAGALEGVRQGGRAAARELRLYETERLDLRAITTQTVLLHGEDDRNVPMSVASWAAGELPHSELVAVPDAAHLFLVGRPDLLLGQVA